MRDLAAAVLAVALSAAPAAAQPAKTPDRVTPATCEYSTYAWSVTAKKAVDHERIRKPYAEVTAAERDPRFPECSVCEADQTEITLEGLKPVRVCWRFADDVRGALRAVQASGEFELRTITGYRPGRTRGRVVDGRRTQLSNHSFGVAVDINARHNGLYGRCKLAAPAKAAVDLKGCKRRMGGPWAPRKAPKLTIERSGVVHREFTKFWRWGGDLTGALKDFMHFSVDGT